MKLESIITAEKVIKDELQKDPTKDIFPITLIKYLLNRKKIVSFFEKIQQTEIQNLPSYIDYDYDAYDGESSEDIYLEVEVLETDEQYQKKLDKYEVDLKRYSQWYEANKELIEQTIQENKIKAETRAAKRIEQNKKQIEKEKLLLEKKLAQLNKQLGD